VRGFAKHCEKNGDTDDLSSIVPHRVALDREGRLLKAYGMESFGTRLTPWAGSIYLTYQLTTGAVLFCLAHRHGEETIVERLFQ
jgi:hypothetical protein